MLHFFGEWSKVESVSTKMKMSSLSQWIMYPTISLLTSQSGAPTLSTVSTNDNQISLIDNPALG